MGRLTPYARLNTLPPTHPPRSQGVVSGISSLSSSAEYLYLDNIHSTLLPAKVNSLYFRVNPTFPVPCTWRNIITIVPTLFHGTFKIRSKTKVALILLTDTYPTPPPLPLHRGPSYRQFFPVPDHTWGVTSQSRLPGGGDIKKAYVSSYKRLIRRGKHLTG